MSATIDEKVVEMRFDNKQFESNVQTTMSTIDKLKQKLNFKGASKGLDNINASAKNVNMGVLGKSIETVQAKFSALEVMGVTALANLTNSAVNAGKRMVSALTIDPIKTGFNEYETKMNSVQTIMSNTASKGTTMADVTRVLDELNTYADKTIYNFQEMTRNIGTFTAAGVGLEESASAIQGIANLAAASGSNSQQASTAMYQLSQALAAGTVKLMDWNSVVNAGMGGEKFQEALKSTAREMGISVDSMIEKHGSFRESLTEGWITADVLNTTLKKFTKEGAAEYADAMVKSGKYTKEQADALKAEAQAMEDAATKVKTFTQLWDTTKEAVQSGWAQTWELIIGDFEEAKETLSALSDWINNIIGKSADARNKLLKGALGGSQFESLSKKIDKATGSTKAITKSTEEYESVVKRVMNGEFGNGQARFDALSEAGYNWAKVQNLVNEKLGDSTRYNEELAESEKKVSKEKKNTIEDLVKMSDAQLKDLGFKKSEIKALRDLEEQSKKTGIPLKDLVKDMDQLSGRTLLINSLKNIGKNIVNVFTAMRDAWVEIFPPMTSEQLYNIIAGFHKLAKKLVISKENVEKIKKTFMGLFAVLDIVRSITGGALSAAFKLLSKILGKFDKNILDVTASIGDMLVGLRNWLKSNSIISKSLDKIADVIVFVIVKIKEWIDTFLGFPAVQNTIEAFKKAFTFENILNTITSITSAVKNFIGAFLEIPIIAKIADKIKNAFSGLEDLGKNLIEGIKNGLNNESYTLWDVVKDIGRTIIDTIKNVLGIHSPSTVMFEIGKNIIQGLFNGIKWLAESVIDLFGGIATSIKDTIDDLNIDWGTVLSIATAAGALLFLKKLGDAIEAFSAPFEGVGNVLYSTAEVVKNFSGVLGSLSTAIKAKAIQSIAIAIAILVGAVIALTFVKPSKVWASIGAIAALATIIGALSVVVGKFGPTESVDFGKIAIMVLALSGAMLLMASALKKIGSLNPDQAEQAFRGFVIIMGSLIAFLYVCGSVIKGKAAQNIDKVGIMLLKVAAVMLLMSYTIKQIGKLDSDSLVKGGIFAAAFLAFTAILSAIGMIPNKGIKQMGKMLLEISASMLLMVVVMKLAGSLEPEEIRNGIAIAMGMALFVTALALVGKLAGDSIPKVGGALLAASAAMLIMAGAVKILGSMDLKSLEKGVTAVAIFGGIIAGLMLVMGMIGNSAPKIAASLLAMSVSIGVLAAVAILLGLVDTKNLAKGVIAVAILGTIVAVMMAVSSIAQDCKGTMLAIAAAIAVLAIAVAGLSLIDPEKLKPAVIALGLLIGMLSVLLGVSSLAKDSTGAMVALSVVIAVLSGAIYLLSTLPIDSVVGSAASIGILVLALSGAMLILSKTASSSKTALTAIGLLIAVVAVLGGAIYLLSTLPIESVIGSSVALSVMLLALSGAMFILAKSAGVNKHALASAAVLTVLVGVLGGVLYLLSGLPWQATLSAAVSLSVVLLTLSIALNLMNGTLAGSAALIIAATALVVLSTALLILSTMDLATVGTVLLALAGTFLILGAAGYLLGPVVPVIAALAVALLAMGIAISGLGLGLMAVSLGFSMIAQTGPAGATAIVNFLSVLINGVGNLIPTIAARIGQLIVAICQVISSSASSIGSTVVTVAMTIINMLGTVVPAAVELFVSLLSQIIQTIADYTPTICQAFFDILVGILNTISGNIESVVYAGLMIIVGFIDGISAGIGDVIDAAINLVISFINGMADGIRNNTDKMILAVDNLMSAVITAIGKWLKHFVLKGKDLIVKLVLGIGQKAKDAKNKVKELASDMLKKITNKIKDFKTAGKDLIAGLIKGIKEKVDKAVDKVKELGGDLADGLKSALGINSPSKVFKELGGYVDDGLIEGVSSKLSDVFSSGEGIGDSILSGFSNSTSGGFGINSLFGGFSDFNTDSASSAITDFAIGTKDAMQSTVEMTEELERMQDVVDRVWRGEFGNGEARMRALTDAGYDYAKVQELVSKTEDGHRLTLKDLSDVQGDSIDNTIGASDALKGFQTDVSNTSNIINGTKDDWYNSGKYVVGGFADGINEAAYRIAGAASAIGQIAIDAVNKTLGIESPSKVFYGIGGYAGQGFVNALNDYGKETYKAGSEMASSAKNGLMSAISKVNDALSNGIDSQPKIRPVIDLSEVEAGANTIGNLLNSDLSLGTISNLNAISSMMSRRNQNGKTGEIVSAIDALRKDLGNIEKPSYTIDGISYDDGSNIAEAVKTLVRAVKVERRI